MPMVTLSEAKLHMKVANTTEDALIQSYIDGAVNFIQRYCGQNFEDAVPPIVKVACLMIVAGMYEGRQHTYAPDAFKSSQIVVNNLVYDYLEQHRVNRGIV